RAQQNDQQFGNQTRVEEWSHAEKAVALGKLDGTEAGTWAYRVKTGQQLQWLRTTVTAYFPNATLHLVNYPARVRVYAGAFDPTQPLTHCLAETRTVYDDLNGDFTAAPTLGLVAKTQQALTACSDTAALDVHDPAWQETRLAYDVYGNQTVRRLVGGGG